MNFRDLAITLLPSRPPSLPDLFQDVLQSLGYIRHATVRVVVERIHAAVRQRLPDVRTLMASGMHQTWLRNQEIG